MGQAQREQTSQRSGRTSTSKKPLARFPTQREARRQRITWEWLTSAEMQQLDITAKDAVLLQREVPVTSEEADPYGRLAKGCEKNDMQRGSRNPANDWKSNTPWFESLRRDLERDNFTYLQPLQPDNRLIWPRPCRFDEIWLRTKN